MNKKETLNFFKKKVSILKRHNKLYYGYDKPEITDKDYDELKKDLFILEKKYSYLKKLNLLENIIGSPPINKFKKIQHLEPMLSLSNAFEVIDLENFLKKINNFLNYKDQSLELFVEPKIDGISATLIYEKGNLKRGLSRGDGNIGEDILENLKTISDLPKQINQKNVPDLLEIRCEVYIGKKDFTKLSENLPIQGMLRRIIKTKRPKTNFKVPLKYFAYGLEKFLR